MNLSHEYVLQLTIGYTSALQPFESKYSRTCFDWLKKLWNSCYVPSFVFHILERQKILFDQYMFTCKCKFCDPASQLSVSTTCYESTSVFIMSYIFIKKHIFS
jgi:hypothetical protein